jgi:hypothetical protein
MNKRMEPIIAFNKQVDFVIVRVVDIDRETCAQKRSEHHFMDGDAQSINDPHTVISGITLTLASTPLNPSWDDRIAAAPPTYNTAVENFILLFLWSNLSREREVVCSGYTAVS